MLKQFEFKVGVVEVNGLKIGRIVQMSKGFMFMPWVCGHERSRRPWPTPADCVPTWAKKTIERIIEKATV